MFDDFTSRVLDLAGQGLCCSQIIVKLAMGSEVKDDPGLIRAMAGLCYGAGGGGLCGILTGGLCLLSLKSTADVSSPVPGDRFLLMADTYREWFEGTIAKTYGGVLCPEILGRDAQGQPDMTKCSAILTESYSKLLEILDGDLT